jgi:diguanylate cyclase (GGDEF)-like protein
VTSWEDTIKELRGQYLSEAYAKLAEADALLARLAVEPRDRDAVEMLVRRFHGFAGSGTSYGFPGVTALGMQGEDMLRPCRDKGKAPDPEDLQVARGLLNEIRDQLLRPVEDEGSETGAESKPPQPPDILVVDDDPALVTMLTRLLEQEGMSVRVAGTRQQAIEIIGQRLPDGLVVDILLPDGSGYDLVEKVRARPDGEAAAIVMISVRTGFLDRVEAIHCGADAFFEKPVDWETLLRRLQALLERSRSEPARVLSVEDDPAQAQFLRTVLGSAGYAVRVCAHPDALEPDLASFRPDLVLMDVRLPGVDGYALARLIRQDERYAALSIVFLTTAGELEAQIASVRAGGDEHLVKPVEPALLLSTVASRIERARFLRSLLNRDGLTRLLTHSAFVERARVAVAKKRRDEARRVAWVMMDLDRFKAINDAHGHPAGDRVIVALSALLRRRVRHGDTVGRYGGEEFALLLEDLNPADAQRLIDRLRDEFSRIEIPTSDGKRLKATFSAGIAFLEPGVEIDRWHKAADDALYAAKAGGRNRVVLAPPLTPAAS